MYFLRIKWAEEIPCTRCESDSVDCLIKYVRLHSKLEHIEKWFKTPLSEVTTAYKYKRIWMSYYSGSMVS